MSKKVGRKDKYETHVLPNFKDIEKWLNEGATEKTVASKLGIAYPTWNLYKRKYKEFGELCAKPRTKLIDDLRSALIKKALGFTLKNKKTYIKENDDGSQIKTIEITETEVAPDCAAIFGALNIYDPDYVKDKKYYELKTQELELKKQQQKSEEW